MVQDKIEVNYEELDEVVGAFSGRSDELQNMLHHLDGQLHLLRTGWIGEGADAFFLEWEDTVRTRILRIVNAHNQAASAINQIAQIFSQAEEEAANEFRNRGVTVGRAAVHGVNHAVSGVTLAQGADNNLQSTTPNYLKMFQNKNIPSHLLSGSRLDLYQGYREGKMSWGDVEKFITADPFAPKLQDYIRGRAVLFDQYTSSSDAVFNAQLSTDIGTFESSVLGYDNVVGYEIGYNNGGLGITAQEKFDAYLGRAGYEGEYGSAQLTVGEAKLKNEASLGIGSDGIKAKLSSEGGINLVRLESNAEYGGFAANMDARVGAEYKAGVESAINPFSGDVYVKTGFEARAGGFVEGSIDKSFFDGAVKVGVSGEVSYGIGAGVNADMGIRDGVLRLDAKLFATTGLGAGAGSYVEVDMREAGKQIVESSSEIANDVIDIGGQTIDTIEDVGSDIVDFGKGLASIF